MKLVEDRYIVLVTDPEAQRAVVEGKRILDASGIPARVVIYEERDATRNALVVSTSYSEHVRGLIGSGVQCGEELLDVGHLSRADESTVAAVKKGRVADIPA